MRHITKVALATAGTAAILAGGGGIALAAAQSATGAASASGAVVTIAAAPATATGISYGRAVQIAKKRVPGGRVTEVEREWEHGHRVWKVELRRGAWEYRVYVTVATGKVIKIKRKLDD